MNRKDDNAIKLRMILAENGITQWELAEMCGVSDSTLARRLRHIGEELLWAISQDIKASKRGDSPMCVRAYGDKRTHLANIGILEVKNE